MEIVVCLCTVPDSKTASTLSHLWVKNHWAACVNRVPQITSCYFWDDNIQEDPEHLLIIKTTRAGSQEIQKNLKNNHPYECPEWIELKATDVLKTYAKWIVNTVKVS